jgi:hypothetical protein
LQGSDRAIQVSLDTTIPASSTRKPWALSPPAVLCRNRSHLFFKLIKLFLQPLLLAVMTGNCHSYF